MRVKINIKGKSLFWLQVEPYYTFRTVKRKLQYLHDIPEAQQIISHNSRVMNPESILSEWHVQNEDTLKIELEMNNIILYCKQTTGWGVTYTVKYSDTIQELKQRFFKSTGLPVEMQRLTLKGFELKNENQQLQDCKFNSGDTVLLKADYRAAIEELKSFCSILEEMTI